MSNIIQYILLIYYFLSYINFLYKIVNRTKKFHNQCWKNNNFKCEKEKTAFYCFFFFSNQSFEVVLIVNSFVDFRCSSAVLTDFAEIFKSSDKWATLVTSCPRWTVMCSKSRSVTFAFKIRCTKTRKVFGSWYQRHLRIFLLSFINVDFSVIYFTVLPLNLPFCARCVF